MELRRLSHRLRSVALQKWEPLGLGRELKPTVQREPVRRLELRDAPGEEDRQSVRVLELDPDCLMGHDSPQARIPLVAWITDVVHHAVARGPQLATVLTNLQSELVAEIPKVHVLLPLERLRSPVREHNAVLDGLFRERQQLA